MPRKFWVYEGLNLNYRMKVISFFTVCLVLIDIVVVYTVDREHLIENLATLLLTEGIIILLLGASATFGGHSMQVGRPRWKKSFPPNPPRADDGLEHGYLWIEGIFILIIGAALIIISLLLLALF